MVTFPQVFIFKIYFWMALFHDSTNQVTLDEAQKLVPGLRLFPDFLSEEEGRSEKTCI